MKEKIKFLSDVGFSLAPSAAIWNYRLTYGCGSNPLHYMLTITDEAVDNMKLAGLQRYIFEMIEHAHLQMMDKLRDTCQMSDGGSQALKGTTNTHGPLGSSHLHNIQAELNQVESIIREAQEELGQTKLKTAPKQCECPMNTLMATGCKCGGK